MLSACTPRVPELVADAKQRVRRAAPRLPSQMCHVVFQYLGWTGCVLALDGRYTDDDYEMQYELFLDDALQLVFPPGKWHADGVLSFQASVGRFRELLYYGPMMDANTLEWRSSFASAAPPPLSEESECRQSPAFAVDVRVRVMAREQQQQLAVRFDGTYRNINSGRASDHSLIAFFERDERTQSWFVANPKGYWHGPHASIFRLITSDRYEYEGVLREPSGVFRPRWQGHYLLPEQDGTTWRGVFDYAVTLPEHFTHADQPRLRFGPAPVPAAERLVPELLAERKGAIEDALSAPDRVLQIVYQYLGWAAARVHCKGAYTDGYELEFDMLLDDSLNFDFPTGRWRAGGNAFLRQSVGKYTELTYWGQLLEPRTLDWLPTFVSHAPPPTSEEASTSISPSFEVALRVLPLEREQQVAVTFDGTYVNLSSGRSSGQALLAFFQWDERRRVWYVAHPGGRWSGERQDVFRLVHIDRYEYEGPLRDPDTGLFLPRWVGHYLLPEADGTRWRGTFDFAVTLPPYFADAAQRSMRFGPPPA